MTALNGITLDELESKQSALKSEYDNYIRGAQNLRAKANEMESCALQCSGALLVIDQLIAELKSRPPVGPIKTQEKIIEPVSKRAKAAKPS